MGDADFSEIESVSCMPFFCLFPTRIRFFSSMRPSVLFLYLFPLPLIKRCTLFLCLIKWNLFTSLYIRLRKSCKKEEEDGDEDGDEDEDAEFDEESQYD
jgi:hypothetical protein